MSRVDSSSPSPSPPSASRCVQVPLGARSYEIRIAPGLVADPASALSDLLVRPRLALVADDGVFALHGKALLARLQAAGITVAVHRVPAGDASKSFSQLERVVHFLLDAGIARDDLVLAFGGGMVGDLAGLAASLVRRGVGLVQIPTTLLAQVDSSVGGKTAINMPQGKNLVGSFYQPRRVLIDPGVLASLPARERRAGIAEVVKYGLIAHAGFFVWLEERIEALDELEESALAEAIAVSCETKARIVAVDEQEQADTRALLNLGHTFAHALEAATGYDSRRLLHGEAVAFGLVLAADLSERLGHASPGLASRISGLLARIGLAEYSTLRQVFDAPPSADHLLTLMGQDKKIRHGRLRFVLMRAIGESFVTDAVPREAVAASLGAVLGLTAENGIEC